jgi:DNA ligase-1
MLARDAPAGIDPPGWLVSEKLDGVRAVWDGRQPALSQRTAGGGAGLVHRRPARAEPLDGELWLGRGRFEACRAWCGAGIPTMPPGAP